MTVNNLNEFKLILQYYHCINTHKMCGKISIGTDWKNDAFKLYTLGQYIDVISEWTLQTQAEYDAGNTNFFSLTEILTIQHSINEMLFTDFNYDFILPG